MGRAEQVKSDETKFSPIASTLPERSRDKRVQKDRIPSEMYEELEAIVGVDNVCDEDFVVASHDWFGLGADPTSKTLLGRPPGAVIMPANTEEVAGIVKCCNRYNVGFKAHSTGYGNYAGVQTRGSIAIDLCRMDSIEIDAESRMAIIEPYATAGRLMAEANKHRLMTHIIGAGAIHSPLASATSFAGMGVGGNHTSNNSRNLLAFEWVTPEGEIVRAGSCGSDANWFTGEGPGPGFRGMIRGVKGAAGALGVFTKIGYKLYPWAGPEKLQWTGKHPQRGIAPPENFATYQLVWKDWEAAADATRKMVDHKVVTFITRTPTSALGHFFSATNRDYYDAHRTNSLPEMTSAENGVGWTVTIMAWSAEEFTWKEEGLEKILSDTDGKKLTISDDERDLLTANSFVSQYITRFARMGDGGGVSLGILDSIDMIPQVVERAFQDLGDEQEPGGNFHQSDSDQNWMWLSEGRHFWTENNPSSTRTSAKKLGAIIYFMLRSFTRMEKKPLGINFFNGGPAYDIFGPELGNAHKWMRKTKQTWDPKGLSDASDYTQLEPPKEAKGAWVMKNVLMHPWMKPITKKIFSSMFD